MNTSIQKNIHNKSIPILKLWLLMLWVLLMVYIIPSMLLSHLFFYHKARGSFVHFHHHLVGSSLYGQAFKSQRYFWGRPSLTTYQTDILEPKDIHWVGDSYWQSFAKNQNYVWKQYGVKKIPEDLLMPSTSQVDPHLTLLAIELQIPRIIQERQIPEHDLRQLIAQNTQKPFLWIYGHTCVNVLKLNLALDHYLEKKHGTTHP